MSTSEPTAGPERGAGADGSHPGTLADDVRAALGWGGRVALVGSMLWIGSALRLPQGIVADLAVGFALGLALLGLGWLIWGLLRWVSTDWVRIVGRPALVATLGALALLLGFTSLPPLLALAVWGAWLGAATGAVLAVRLGLRLWRARRWSRPYRGAPPVAETAKDRRGRIATAALAGFGALLALTLAGWWLWPGSVDPTTPLAAGDAPPLELHDPGAAGPWRVASLRYGSGAPRWRPEYGAAAALRTSPIDMADLVALGPVARPARRAALCFELSAVPRNAIVWYPAEGDGPYPLVLLAHGNANLFVASEDGYAWLGEHLASHGFVVASIDASAFNALPVVGGLRGENHARALLMLAHLDLWHGWEAAAEPGLPRVDLSRVALAGHSRGGEAAAIAASLDRLGRLPADALVPLAERVGGPHGVRAVVALAPSDGQYRVGDRPTALVGVDYLVVHGGYDGDVSSFVGERQYERAQPAEGGFKAAVYVHHANHGQFNDAWGRSDQPPPLGPLLRTAAIMPSGDQQRAGAVLIGAFLRASLLGEDGYRELFRDPRRAAHWLPATTYVTRFDDGDGITLQGGEAAVEPDAGSLPGSRVTTEGLALWRVGDPGYRAGVPREATAVTLGWSRAEDEPAPSYRLRLPVAVGELVDDPQTTLLTLELGRAAARSGDAPRTPAGALDASLELVDEAGERAALPLSSAQGVPPHLPTVVTRLGPFEAVRYRPAVYPLYQRVDLPLAALLAENPALELTTTFEVALVFDRDPEGIVAVRSLRLTTPVVPAPPGAELAAP
jgi:hypothetical protein